MEQIKISNRTLNEGENEFLNSFEKLELPLYGVRCPEIEFNKKDLMENGVKEYKDNFDLLKQLCNSGYKQKILPLKEKGIDLEVYKNRVKEEVGILNKLGFVDYILIVWDVFNFCNKESIPTGLGRGSAAGSLVLYLLGVTGIDPIKYGLFFQRFVSEVRAKKQVVDGITYLDGSMIADIDSDICYYRRKEVVEYLDKKYPNRTSKMLTVSTLSGKALIKDCGKIVGEKDESEMNRVTSLFPTKFGKVEELEVVYDEVEEFQNWADENKLVYEIAQKLKNLIRNKGVHASGTLVGYDELTKTTPVELSADKERVSGFTMDWATKVNIKLDLLGLKSVSVIDEVARLTGINYHAVDLEDYERIYAHLQDLKNPKGIFQIEADTNYKVCKEVKPKNLDQLSAVVALARPGALAFVEQYAKYAQTGVFPETFPQTDEILKETGGAILYQESLMSIGNRVFGLTLDESEQIRKCVVGETMFLSKTRGWISIKDLIKSGYKEDLFYVMDEKGRSFWKKIKKIWSNGKKAITRVNTVGGLHVDATQYHQFLTEKGWVARRRLEKGDFLLSPSKVDWDGNSKISREMAIVCISLICEGYFCRDTSSHFTNWDKELMSIYESAYYKEFGVYPKKDKLGRVAYVASGEKQKIAQIIDYGKSAVKKVPQEIMSLDKETMREVLGLFFSYEGSVDNRQGVGYMASASSASKQIIDSVQLMLLRYGIYAKTGSKVNKKYNRRYYYLNIYDMDEFVKFFKELSPFFCRAKKDLWKQTFDKAQLKTFQNQFSDCIPPFLIKKFLRQYPNAAHQMGQAKYSASGRLYSNKKVKRDAIADMFLYSGDKDWIELSSGNQRYVEFKDQSYSKTEVEVYDFTVDEETPFIVANGIVIHNCVGKKKTHEMPKWEAIIRQKAKELNLPDGIDDFYWSALSDSANYSFCRGHALPYAAMAALTVFYKFNYPQQFFLALLRMAKHESDSLEEIAKISIDMKEFGIELLPPDLNKSGDDFEIEGGDIRYGLSAIKGISEKIIGKFSEFRGTYSSKIDLFIAAKQAKISIGVVSALIQAGALESLRMAKSRSFCVLEAQVWNMLKDREKIEVKDLIDSGEFKDVISCVKYLNGEKKDEKGKPFIKDSRYATIKRDYDGYKTIYMMNSRNEELANFFYEKELLGRSYSESLAGIYQKKAKNIQTIKEFQDMGEMDKGMIVGVILDKVARTSAKGNPYIKYTVQDESGTIDCFIFSSKHRDKIEMVKEDNGGRLPEKKDIVLVQGARKDETAMYVDKLGIQSAKIFMKLKELKDQEDAKN